MQRHVPGADQQHLTRQQRQPRNGYDRVHMHGDRVWRSMRTEMMDDIRDETRKHREPDQRHIGREKPMVRWMA